MPRQLRRKASLPKKQVHFSAVRCLWKREAPNCTQTGLLKLILKARDPPLPPRRPNHVSFAALRRGTSTIVLGHEIVISQS